MASFQNDPSGDSTASLYVLGFLIAGVLSAVVMRVLLLIRSDHLVGSMPHTSDLVLLPGVSSISSGSLLSSVTSAVCPGNSMGGSTASFRLVWFSTKITFLDLNFFRSKSTTM